jgi:hypothetical protein
MLRMRLLGIVLVAAGLAWAGGAHAAEEAKTVKAVPHGFFAKYLTPRMDSGLTGEIEAATRFANPGANTWTRDDATISRIERRAIRATKGAVKRYAIESLGINEWSLPLIRGAGTGLDALKTDSGGPRLLFGFSHRAVRAEVLIPVTSGRVGFSADVMGRVGITFETPASGLRFGAAVDPRDHSGTFGLTSRF